MKRLKMILKPVIRSVAALSPSCRDLVVLTSRPLQKSLPWDERLGMKTHLLICRWCRRYEKQLSFLREAVNQCPEHPPAQTSLSPDARRRLKRKLGRPRTHDHHESALND
jgi:hypothetical protein